MKWTIDQSDDELEALINAAREFVSLVAHMKTDEEYGEYGMPGDDAAETLSALITKARELLPSRESTELDCGCFADDYTEVVDLTNGAEVCRPCFNAGANESNTVPLPRLRNRWRQERTDGQEEES